MPSFEPIYEITPAIAQILIRIEATKEKVAHLPLTPNVLINLRESARLRSTHFSTKIEGNRLTQEQVISVITKHKNIPGRERDEKEVKGYYIALSELEKWVARDIPITEHQIQLLHALVMADGKTMVKPTPYRDGQNVIYEGGTRRIVYLPPEAQDVPKLMKDLITWIKQSNNIPAPIVAAIAHYQFATIHPYYDGNGRTARLLMSWILHKGGYGLKGLYSLEEYYAHNLGLYYDAISVGPSHNYYEGRAQTPITHWIAYACEGIAISCEKVITHMQAAQKKGESGATMLLRTLDPKQRKALELFKFHDIITAQQIGELFGFKPRTSSALCAQWIKDGFLEIVNASKKGRSYRLGKNYRALN
jgi:Fic family protein